MARPGAAEPRVTLETVGRDPPTLAGFGQLQDGRGAFAFAVDPVNQGTLHLGGGLWRAVLP
jgi:hypothetical protein